MLHTYTIRNFMAFTPQFTDSGLYSDSVWDTPFYHKRAELHSDPTI